MVQVFALEIDARAAELFGQALGGIKRRGAADEQTQILGEFLLEGGIDMPPNFPKCPRASGYM
jgi:hypothetical protein